MRLSKIAARVIPALALSTGSAWAADSESITLPGNPLLPGTIVSKPLWVSSDSSRVPPLTLTGQTGPAEIAPPPRVNSPGEKYTAPLPPTVPEFSVSSEPIGLFAENFGHKGLSWARAEYLFWYMTGGHVSPLITTSPAGELIAVPGFPGQSAVFGGNNPLEDPRSGGRFTIGTWLDETRMVGVEASVFFIGTQRDGFRASSPDGSTLLASSPFFDLTANLPTAVLISFPGVAAGTVDVDVKRQTFWGGEALLRTLLSAGDGWRVDGLAGYRYRGFSERLDIKNSINFLGTTIVSSDMLRASNTFQGGVIGIDCERDCGYVTANLRPSIGVGPMFTTVDRQGFTAIRVPGLPDAVFPGGTYNLSSNIGQVHSNDWTVIPELDFRLSKTVWECIRLSIGYSAIYIPSVARVGEQIDPFINPALLPPAIPGGALRPAAILEHSSTWLHGFTFGVEVRF